MAVPKIRIKGFEAEWKETTWGKLTSNFKYGINAAATPYDGQNKYLRITDIDDISRVFIQENLTSPGIDLSYCNEYIMQHGDIVIARTGASVGKSYIYHDTDGKVYFAGFLIRMRLNDDIDKDFVFQNTLTNSFAKHIQIVSQRSGQPGVNVDELKSYSFSMPLDKDEQQALGSYFQHLDSLIQSTTMKIATLKQTKQASLQSMFPQEGETKPRVRFKGFTDEWKKVLIEDMCKVATGKSNTQDQVSNGNYPFFIRSEKVARSNRYLHDLEAVITIGDGNIGKVFHYINGKFDLHQRCYMIYNFNTSLYAKYFYYYFTTYFYARVIKMSAKATVDSVRLDMITKMEILIPSFEEQKQIAEYFSNLDKQISIQEQRLEKLKQIKSACLKNMFV